MLFKAVSETFSKIEKISSRLKITQELAELFKKATGEEIKILCYLSMGSLRAPYEETQFGIAKKTMANVLGSFFKKSPKTIMSEAHALGDLGAVTASGFWYTAKNLDVLEVYTRLCQIEAVSGIGSQEAKSRALLDLLFDIDPTSAQIIVRIILGSLRLGFSDMTIVDALSWMEVGDKSLRKKIEHAYNISADLGRIAKILKEEGIEGIEKVNIVVGIPILPAAAERLPSSKEIIKKLGKCVAQPKLDGFRLQIHVFKIEGHKKIRFFSRNLKDMSNMFPDLVHAFDQYNIKDLIAEGEALVYDPKQDRFLSFQETVKRKRKHGIDEMVTKMPLKLFLFDILYYDDKSLLNTPHWQRRKILLDLFSSEHEKTISVIDEKPIETAKDIETYFEKSRASGLEGLVIKRPDAPYQPGKRNFNWIKLKSGEAGSLLEDTIDCVILGYYYGSGKRATFGIGAFLVGIYDTEKDVFETIAKVGTGLTDEEWKTLKRKCDTNKVLEQPHNVICAKELYPNVWVYPEIICTIKADEITHSPLHTAGKTQKHEGLALRFPRFENYRPDKSAKETTTLKEVKRLLEDQKLRGNNK